MIHHTVRFLLASSLLLIPLVAVPSSAQQPSMRRYTIYTGFSNLYTPKLNDINQIGFHLQAGINQSRWFASGFDYSVQNGSLPLTANLATPRIQRLLAAQLPPGYVMDIHTNINTQTFTAGTQLTYRHFAKWTFFVRPSLTAFRLSATPKPTDPIATLIVKQLVPSGKKTDWTGGYGVGGGVEYSLNDHFGVRAQYDGVWNHPFNDILGEGSWANRFSIGPSFNFGRKTVLKR